MCFKYEIKLREGTCSGIRQNETKPKSIIRSSAHGKLELIGHVVFLIYSHLVVASLLALSQ